MGKNLKPLWPYLNKYRVTLFWGAITVLFNNGLWVLSPQVVRRAVDDLNHHGITQHKILIYSALLIGLALGKGVFQFLTRWLVIGVSRETPITSQRVRNWNTPLPSASPTNSAAKIKIF